LFIGNVCRHKLSIESIGICTDDVQVNVGGLGQGGFAANEHALLVWLLLLNDGALQDRFDELRVSGARFAREAQPVRAKHVAAGTDHRGMDKDQVESVLLLPSFQPLDLVNFGLDPLAEGDA
jgi:hypothetical protein